MLVEALLLVMAAAYTFAGVNGFLKEKKSGALELILVTPLSVNQIIFGRVWGLWKQFLPSLLILAGSDIAVQVMLPHRHDFFNYGFEWDINWSGLWMEQIEIAAIYLTLPVVATCFALSANNLYVAAVGTVAAGFVPGVIFLFRDWLDDALQISHPTNRLGFDIQAFLEVSHFPPLLVCVLVAQAGAAFWAYRYLRRSLARRSYAF
jgi:hypothetical protein